MLPEWNPASSVDWNLERIRAMTSRNAVGVGRNDDEHPLTAILLMADWGGACLWNRSPTRDETGADDRLDQEDLGLPAELVERIGQWCRDFGSERMDRQWWNTGWTIANDLQRDFERRGLDIQVSYSDWDGRVVPVGARRRPPRV